MTTHATAAPRARHAPPPAGDPYIRVTVDGLRFNVHYEDGAPYWVRTVASDGTLAAGHHVSRIDRRGTHATAVRLAETFLRGLRDAQPAH